MAKTYVATRRVKIGQDVFKEGEVITGVSQARCEHLNGRFIKAVSEKSGKDTDKSPDKPPAK